VVDKSIKDLTAFLHPHNFTVPVIYQVCKVARRRRVGITKGENVCFFVRKQSIHLDVKIQRFPDDNRIITGNKELKRDKERLQVPI